MVVVAGAIAFDPGAASSWRGDMVSADVAAIDRATSYRVTLCVPAAMLRTTGSTASARAVTATPTPEYAAPDDF
ncbi:MAG: hypothetical protein R3E65_12300 [Steroidobacteraceae bacterium]